MNFKLYEYALNKFNKFIDDNFDINDSKIKHKLLHTYKVIDNSKYICEYLKLDIENTNLAMVIALLHDIGRFTQAKEMKTFREDITNYDHATLGVKLLFDNGFISNFIDTDVYNDIISCAIGNHSKYILDTNGLSDTQILHCKIIRDADKLDSFRAKVEDDIYTMANITAYDIETSYITDKVYDDFMNHKTILSKDRKTGIDIWISYIAFVYGLEFKCSYNFIIDHDYINKLFDRFSYAYDNEKISALKREVLLFLETKVER